MKVLSKYCVFLLALVLLFSGCDEKNLQEHAKKLPTPLPGEPVPMCSNDARYFGNLPVACVPVRWNFSYRTPKGIRVVADEDIQAEHRNLAFQALDAGIDNLLAATNAKFPHWNKAKTHSDFRVGFIRPAPYDGQYPPELFYGGQVYTAGTVFGFMDDAYQKAGNPITIILPNYNVSNWKELDTLMYATWNEGEHYRELENDLEEARKYFTDRDVHQHHPMPPGIPVKGLGLAGAQAQGLLKKPERARCAFSVRD